jgi:adenylylsulfate kinase
VHLSTPLDICAERDVKGLYAKAFRGELTGLTGVDGPYEVPANPDLRLDTSAVDQDTAVRDLLDLLDQRWTR